jgi:hypothetical protein
MWLRPAGDRLRWLQVQKLSGHEQWQLAAIRSIIKTASVEFVAENSGGPGVRLRKAD